MSRDPREVRRARVTGRWMQTPRRGGAPRPAAWLLRGFLGPRSISLLSWRPRHEQTWFPLEARKETVAVRRPSPAVLGWRRVSHRCFTPRCSPHVPSVHVSSLEKDTSDKG